MTTYINGKLNGKTETIDEFETYGEAKEMIKEYRISFQGSGYQLWLSSRSTKEWSER